MGPLSRVKTADSRAVATGSGGGGPAIGVRGLSYRYRSGRSGIDALDLEVRPGEIVVLLGPNGSGKTTALRLLADDLTPSAGEVTHACGRSRRDRLACTGYAPDSAAQIDELTGRENARVFGRAFGAGDDATDRLIARFGLSADADVAAGQYSFGMRRKLALVQALAHTPAVLLMDEPTIGLDPVATGTLHEILREHAQAGAAIVIATNDSRITVLADVVVFIHEGRVMASGSPAELLQSVEGATRIEVTLDGMPERTPDLPPDITASRSSSGLVFTVANGSAALPGLCSALVAAGARIRRVDIREPGFDDVFRQLTGVELGADPGPTGGAESALMDGEAGGGVRPNDRPRRGPPWRRR